MKRIVALGVAAIVGLSGLLLFSAVGGASSEARPAISKPATVAAYAKLVCPTETVADRGMTWGTVTTNIRDKWTNKWSRIVPPESVYEWHSTREALARHMLATAKGKDPASLYNPLDLWLDDENWQVLLAWDEEAGGDLTASDRATLSNAGCDVAAASVQVPAPTSTPTPTPTTAPNQQTVTLSGTGSSTKSFSLTSGLWIAELSLTGNEDCSYRSCIDDNFIVWINSVSGGSVLAANEIETSWTGSEVFRVGSSYLADLEPGRQVMDVDAAGSWTVTIRPA